jgi:hypothetical protein
MKTVYFTRKWAKNGIYTEGSLFLELGFIGLKKIRKDLDVMSFRCDVAHVITFEILFYLFKSYSS